MKKLLVFSLAFVLVISALLLVGCNKEPEKEPAAECPHSYEKTVTTPPTCTAAGEERFSCTKCDHFYTAEIKATGHTGGTPVEENRVATCVAVAEGKYDSVVYCTVCDAEVSRETVTVGVAGVHNVQNGVCTACGGKESTPGLKYSQNDDGTYTVTGIGTCAETDIVIGIYNNRDVTTIDDYAFSYSTSFTSIELPDSLTTIGVRAFYECTSLASIVIPEGVTSIGEYAFFNCDSLTRIVIPEGVTSIGEYAFYYCDSLTSIELPDSLTIIGNAAFSGCTSLTSITVAEGNENYNSVDGNLYSKDGKTLIQYAIGKTDTAFIVPEGVTTIGGYAFRYCSSLTSIELPDSLTTIRGYAFDWCTSLTRIVIPEGVTTIGNFAFDYCPSLTIYCEVAEKPSGWSLFWNGSYRPVVWGYTGE